MNNKILPVPQNCSPLSKQNNFVNGYKIKISTVPVPIFSCNVHCTVLQHSKHIKHQVSTTKNDPITLNFLSMIWIRTNMMQTREPKFTYIRKPKKYIYLWFLPVFPGISCRHPGDHPPHRRLQTAESILKVGWKN